MLSCEEVKKMHKYFFYRLNKFIKLNSQKIRTYGIKKKEY